MAKRIGLSRKGPFPERINQIAVVALDNVGAQIKPASEVIQLDREPTSEEHAQYVAEFEALDPPTRYRGKFSLLFLFKWLDALVDDYSAKNSKYFDALPTTARARRNEISLASLAARSDLPRGFAAFIDAV